VGNGANNPRGKNEDDQPTEEKGRKENDIKGTKNCQCRV